MRKLCVENIAAVYLSSLATNAPHWPPVMEAKCVMLLFYNVFNGNSAVLCRKMATHLARSLIVLCTICIVPLHLSKHFSINFSLSRREV